ncbi:hypothetical protein NTGBS_10002 [Candidatus Nitrotoga sp. BS]|nr:hypothetical protein NTGBS_10002 [Candidatus Nitrotoga sp. BS]
MYGKRFSAKNINKQIHVKIVARNLCRQKGVTQLNNCLGAVAKSARGDHRCCAGAGSTIFELTFILAFVAPFGVVTQLKFDMLCG